MRFFITFLYTTCVLSFVTGLVFQFRGNHAASLEYVVEGLVWGQLALLFDFHDYTKKKGN